MYIILAIHTNSIFISKSNVGLATGRVVLGLAMVLHFLKHSST
jgi:hypothetical protein